MLNLVADIPARTRIRANILYQLGYLTQSMIDSSSREQLIALVNAMHLVVHTSCGMKDRKELSNVSNQ